MRQPVVVNLGAGVDSTGMLVGLWRHKLPDLWPVDLVLFADTGGEKPETYEYLRDELADWLARHDMPPVTTVKYRPVRAPYDTLEGNCLANETLPSIAFRGGGPGSGGCSLKFKASVMDHFIRGRTCGANKHPGWAPFYAACAAGARTIRCIGYDASPRDTKRRNQCDSQVHINHNTDSAYEYRYPLQEWGWTRERCEDEILRAGLTVPVKSACYFCPASKKYEVAALAASYPDLFLRAVRMEDRAAAGRHGLKPKRGLGINFRWRAYAEAAGFLYPVQVSEGAADYVDVERAARVAETIAPSPDALVQLGGRFKQRM